MRAIWILVLFLNGILLSAQTIQFSRHYAGGSKRVPLQILNQHSDYFFVLRYNREIHDLIIEKRAKPGAELMHIYPLQLDSVNAHWFDYERLDYLFFEKEGQLFFVFEKVLNSKSTVYMKVLNTQGQLSSFISILSEQRNNSKAFLNHHIKVTDEGYLQILSELTTSGNGLRKNVILYDPVKQKILWQKKLPIENALTGYSNGHVALADGRLYYLVAYDRLLNYQRVYTINGSSQAPVFTTDSVKLFLLNQESNIRSGIMPTNFMNSLHEAIIIPDDNALTCAIRYVQADTNGSNPCFLVCNWSADLSVRNYDRHTRMDDHLITKLTYFDGSDIAEASAKRFRFLSSLRQSDEVTILEERVEGNYYKEILYWTFDLKTGMVLEQVIIPRKLFFFPQRSNYRQLGATALIKTKNATSCFLLENKSNQQLVPGRYDHKNFGKQTQLRHGALVQYQVEKGNTKKRLLFENDEFDYIPLKYVGWGKDFIFFLSKNKAEKFAILTDCPF